MPQRIPMQTVIVQRDGKNFAPPIGKPFDFTVDELNQIKKVNPNAVRVLVNETAPVAENANDALAKAQAKAQEEAERQAAAEREAQEKVQREAEEKANAAKGQGKKGGKKDEDEL